jgi:hypothetical protein
VTTVRADSKRRRNEQIMAGLLVTLPRLERKGLSKAVPMKLFKAFCLDTANHLLWRNGDRVSGYSSFAKSVALIAMWRSVWELFGEICTVANIKL